MMCIVQHGFGVVAARWQLANANMDDDQRYGTTVHFGKIWVNRRTSSCIIICSLLRDLLHVPCLIFLSVSVSSLIVSATEKNNHSN